MPSLLVILQSPCRPHASLCQNLKIDLIQLPIRMLDSGSNQTTAEARSMGSTLFNTCGSSLKSFAQPAAYV
jgi:hypothetical protein